MTRDFDANSLHSLSVVIITFNEERNIEDCLISVLPVADEIIVVDSLSTDKTKEICMKYPVRWLENPFPGHIEQKNLAANFACCDYVLSLDADERLDKTLAAEILKLKKVGFLENGYKMNRLNNYCGQWITHGEWYPEYKLRIWKRGAGQWGGDNPHDCFELTDQSKGMKIKGNILHYSFRTYAEHIAQMNKFSSIAAQTLFSKGKRPLFFKPFLSGFWAFFNGYFLKMGFLDGFNGYVIARNNAMYSFFKYAKLNELHKGESHLKRTK